VQRVPVPERGPALAPAPEHSSPVDSRRPGHPPACPGMRPASRQAPARRWLLLRAPYRVRLSAQASFWSLFCSSAS